MEISHVGGISSECRNEKKAEEKSSAFLSLGAISRFATKTKRS